MTRMKFGALLAPHHPIGEHPTLQFRSDLDFVALLDRLGYDEFWCGEHHSTGWEMIASPEMFLAAAAERTHRIRLGTGVVSLPYHNPFTVAGRLMQLDYMTRGRAMFGVGPGSLVYDAVKMGLAAADQRRKLDESLDVIMELMQGRVVTKKTDWFDLREARLQLKSYSQPMMEMAVASSRSPTGALAAGKHGIGMLSIGGTSDDALKAHASNWGVYEEAARANGKTPDRRKWRIVTFAHVADTKEQAFKDVRFGLEDFRRYFTEVATFPIIPPDVANPIDWLIETGIGLKGGNLTGWGYGGETHPDNSNTQFALLGLWAARRHKVPVERSLEMADLRFQRSQNRDAGWGYHVGAGSTPTMTCVGLLGLAMGHGSAEAQRAGD